jgi:hypothetical protein
MYQVKSGNPDAAAVSKVETKKRRRFWMIFFEYPKNKKKAKNVLAQ